MSTIKNWLLVKWGRRPDPALAEAYRATFSTPYGQRVLSHLIDSVYCTIYEGKDLLELGMHNGRRSLVHEIIENIDLAEHPGKYQVKEETEAPHGVA